MAVAQGKVVAITGKVIAVAVDGSQRILKAGDIVAVGERLIVPADAAIELQAANGNTIKIAEARDLTITDDVFGSAVADASDAAIALLNQDAQQVLAALENGQDPLQGLEATAAGLLSEGGQDGGASFTRLARVAETIDPLSLDIGTVETPQVIEQASTLGDDVKVLAQVLAVEGDDVAEGSSNNFVVTFSAGNVATTVNLQLSSGTATVGEDTGSVRVVINGVEQTVALAQDGKFSVQLPAGATSFQVLVDTVDDYLAEKSEAYSLSAMANGTEANGTASITDEVELTEDDTVYAQIEVDHSSVAESGQLTYTVSLVDKDGNAVSIPTGKEVSVNLVWGGVAVDGNDTSALPGSVTIGTGGSTSFTVTAKDDYLLEGSEALVATISGAGSNTAFEQVGIVAGKGVANSAITDEATPGPEDTVYAKIEVDRSSVAEGGTLTYTVSLVDKDGKAVSLPAGKEVTLNLSWSGAAVDGNDTSALPSSVTIGASGSTSFTVTANKDDQLEDSEALVATLTGAGSNTAFEQIGIVAGKGVANSIITDVAPRVPVPEPDGTVYAQIVVDKLSVAEGGQLKYTVSLVDSNGAPVSIPSGKEVTLNLSWSGDAANGEDTSIRPASVTIGASGSASFTVTANNDDQLEDSEALVATITGAGSNTAFDSIAVSADKGSASSAVTDENSDPQDPQNPLDGVTAQIVVDKSSVAEGGQLKYTVSLVDSEGRTVTLPEGKEVTLNLSWSGTAANDDDASIRPVTVTIGANGTAEFSVEAKDDDLQEDSEGLVATLTGVGTNTAFDSIAISASKGAASSEVTDETSSDPQNPLDGVTAQIVVDQSSVAEGGQLTYTVSLVDSEGKTVSLPEGKVVTLNLDWSGAAANDGDTAGRPATVTLGADGTAVFTVDAKDDDLQEDSEGLVATLTGAASNTAFDSIAISASKGVASSEVTDSSGNEPQPPLDGVTAQIVVDKSSVAEGGQLKYTVSLVDSEGQTVSLPEGKSVTLNLSWSGTAANDDDASIRPDSITIGANGTAVFTVDAKDDDLKEDSEGLVATLTGAASNTAFESIAISESKGAASSAVTDESGDPQDPQNPLDSAFTLQLFAVTADGQLLSGDSTVSEEGETSAYYVVRAVDGQGNVLATQPGGSVSVSFGNLGSTSSSDYSASQTTVTVGEVFSAKAVDDVLADNGEQFQVSLNGGSYSAAANYEKVDYNSATVTTTIVDNDAIVSLQEVIEGSAGNVLNVASGVEFVGQTQLGGTVSLNAAGQYVYQAPVRDHSDSASDVDSFSYTKADGATVTYTINILDTDPLAANDSGTVNTGLNVQTAGTTTLLANDSVVDNSVANAAKVYTVTGENGLATELGNGEVTVAGKYGDLTVKADGSYIYTSKLDTDITAAEGAAALKASFGVYGFQTGAWQTGDGLNLTGLTANATALVDVRTSGGNAKPGIGVSQSGSGTNDIGGGETLVVGLKVASNFVQIGINELNKGQGDASWKAYDANGHLVGAGTLVSTSNNGSLQSFNISTTTAFKYVALGYSGSQNGYVIDSIKYTPAEGAVTESFSYTVKDNDGDISNTATLTLNGTPLTTVSPTALLTTEDTDVALNWAAFGISDAGASVRVSGNQNGNGTIQYKDANGVFKVLGQNETSTFSKSDIDAGKVKFVPKEHVSGTDLYGDSQGIGNKGKDLGSIKFDVLKDNVEIAHGKEVTVDVVPLADKPLLSLSAYQSLAAMDFDSVNLSVNLNGGAWSSAIDLNTVGGASGIGTWQANGGGKIEVGKESVYISGGSGSNQVMEIEGEHGVSQIYTDIQCEAGRFYQLNFDVGARTTGDKPVSTNGMKILLVQLDASGNPIAASQKELFDFSPTQVGWSKGQQLSLGIEQSGSYRLIFQSKDAGDTYGAVLDNIKFQAVDNKGYEDTFIKLSAINAALVDVDGSETLSVVISGLPEGAVLKDAANHSVTIGEDGKADVSGWSLSSLQIKVNDPGNYNLLVKATATEVDTSGKVLDTEENEITLPVEVLQLNAAPVEITLPSQADGSTVIEGSTTSHGSILANDGITEAVSKLYVSLDGGGTKVEVAAGGTELDTGHGKVTIRPDGSYTFVANVVNHSGDADNKVSDSFSYKAVTASGETAWTAVSVNVLDTNPVAVDDYAAGSTVGTTLSGDVLINDAAVDGGKSVTGFSYLGKDYVVGATTDDGRFTLNADGRYTLKALTATLDGEPTAQQLASGKVGSFELTGLNSAPPASISSFSAGQNLGYNSSGASSGKVGWSVDALHASRHTVDGGETLLVKLGGTATQVTLTIAELNAGAVKLVAYDAVGNKIVLVDDTITSDDVGKNGKPADFIATSKDGTPIAYVAMTYEGTSVDTGKGKDDSQGFVLKGMSYTELLKPASIEYTMKDADGDTDKARLTLDLAQVVGSSGNDQITVLHGEAGTGLDVWAQLQPSSGASAQMVQTGSTNQVIDSKGGNDYVEGGAGNDIIYLGDSGSETIAGHAPTQADVLKMGLMTIAGLSDLVTDASDNSLSTAARTYDHTANTSGIAWADLAHGGSGNDVIHGQAGVDLIYGGSGNDTLLGGSGDDGLRGGAGDDLLIGGQGNDVLRGDTGIDTFKWQLGDQGTAGVPARDVVMDFNVAEGDKLDLADLLQGENAGNLEQYLHFTASGSDTLVQISSAGAFKDGNYSTATDQQILLKGVALSSLAVDTSSDNHIITELLKNNLKTD